jgi:flagellar motor component MotA
MKKLEIKKIDLRALLGKSKGTMWQKAVMAALLCMAVLFTLGCGYLFFKPLSADIKKIIDDEISSVDIIFDQKTIDGVKERQKPIENTGVTTGKNPFASF